MHRQNLYHYSFILLVSFQWILVLAIAQDCPPLGPVLPPLHHPSHGTLICSVVANLSDSLKTQIAYEKTFVSISLTSIHEDIPLLDLHHTPAILSKAGTSNVDAHTVYRIGSISKLFTMLATLLQGDAINWAASVTDYLPELKQIVHGQSDRREDLFGVRWDEVTVEALATHMAGIGRECRRHLFLHVIPALLSFLSKSCPYSQRRLSNYAIFLARFRLPAFKA